MREVLVTEKRNVLNTGLGALWPRPQRLVRCTMPHSASSWRRSARLASPSQMRVSSMWSCVVPTRQGRHFPQDSSRQKSMKYFATSTMRVVSSITIMPPDPMIEPSDARDS